ncbi:MAG: UDP-N-acetylglucosamine:LPS N-acetylglucosamine transferase [Nocardioidaceae bacterium]|nr:UDP-N-acetylglucosamine:LPS N-acetylglucosamine transferase [Nocardioidaceae bacterium]
MIGYYVHHQGRGHGHRAASVARALNQPITGISSAAQPDGWPGEWLQIPRDDDAPCPADVDAFGQLHWAPQGDDGLRARMSMVSGWISKARPRLMVVDVSVEIALLARLHGVPIVSFVLPGNRGDQSHHLVHQISRALLAAWPASAEGMVTGLSTEAQSRLVPVGAISRFPARESLATSHGERPKVVVLNGAGGSAFTGDTVDRAQKQASGWDWHFCGMNADTWLEDPEELMRSATVMVTQAGQNSIAEVAALRKPAIVIPQPRPFEEQHATAAVLARQAWPAVVRPQFPETGWDDVLSAAAQLDGSKWSAWCDGRGAYRAAAVIDRELALVASEES